MPLQVYSTLSRKKEPFPKKPGEPAKKAPEEQGGAPIVFDIGNISIERASVAYIDQQAGQEYMLEDFRLKTGRIADDAQGKLELAMVAKRKQPALEARLSADGSYQIKDGVVSADVNAKLDESTIKAKFTVAEPYQFEASIDKINLDRYIGGAEPASGEGSVTVATRPWRSRRDSAG